MKLMYRMFLGTNDQGEAAELILKPTRNWRDAWQRGPALDWNDGELVGDIIARHTQSTAFITALHNVLHEELSQRREETTRD